MFYFYYLFPLIYYIVLQLIEAVKKGCSCSSVSPPIFNEKLSDTPNRKSAEISNT